MRITVHVYTEVFRTAVLNYGTLGPWFGIHPDPHAYHVARIRIHNNSWIHITCTKPTVTHHNLFS